MIQGSKAFMKSRKVLDEELPKLKFADQQVGFVKVDVEGFECHVWRGARELLKQRPRFRTLGS